MRGAWGSGYRGAFAWFALLNATGSIGVAFLRDERTAVMAPWRQRPSAPPA